MKARGESCCAKCGRLIRRGDRIRPVDGYGWCHVKPSCAQIAAAFGPFAADVVTGAPR